jgi:uncharacterized membrane protein YgdD (TMEM256/DUF423 family)
MKNDRWFAFAGAVNAAFAVAAGAFGAHGLRERIDERHLSIFETGARYQMYHALGLFAVAWLCSREQEQRRGVVVAGWLMLAGIVLFSGSLYALALTGTDALGAITPFGGACFIAAWTTIAVCTALERHRG